MLTSTIVKMASNTNERADISSIIGIYFIGCICALFAFACLKLCACNTIVSACFFAGCAHNNCICLCVLCFLHDTLVQSLFGREWESEKEPRAFPLSGRFLLLLSSRLPYYFVTYISRLLNTQYTVAMLTLTHMVCSGIGHFAFVSFTYASRPYS